jgi:hypothetical protein
MRNATGNPNLKIPANPVYIDFPWSDGDSRTWPSNIQYVVDNEGQVNYMKELEIDHPIALKWRLIVGKALALDMGRERTISCPCSPCPVLLMCQQPPTVRFSEIGRHITRCTIITKGLPVVT